MKDHFAAILAHLLKRLLRYFAHASPTHTLTGKALLKNGIAIYQHHYYHPFMTAGDLRQPLCAERNLPGLTLDTQAQLNFVQALEAMREFEGLLEIGNIDFENNSFGPGDADILYAIIRHLKPARLVEIGAGQSTRIAQAALSRNKAEDASYSCRHVCVEPYEQPWLEAAGVELVRERVELCDKYLFTTLQNKDILFVDSSHIIRPQGDVLFEILEVLPQLQKGVFVHFHDIFTPFDYPDEWIFSRKLLWNEQYILEAFLSMNYEFEIVAAANWLTKTQTRKMRDLLPGLKRNPHANPGSLWIRRL